jgi:hypothetical protein
MSLNPSLLENVRVEVMNPHFTKYHLGNGMVLHHFTAALDREFHDHPWPFVTRILDGGYEEKELKLVGDHLEVVTHLRCAGDVHQVEAGTIHIITRLLGPDCWTLITPGEKEREPGFYQVREGRLWHRYWHEAGDAWKPLAA